MSEPGIPKRVAVLIGNTFGTVDETDLPNMPKGTRVLSTKEVEQHDQDVAEEQVQARYDALPTYRKAAGVVGTALSSISPLTFGQNPDAPPTIAAYGRGVRHGLTGGLSDAAERKLADVAGGKAAGDRYAEQVTQEREASPIAHGIGESVGLSAGLVSGAGGAAENLATRGLARAGVEGATSVAGKAAVAATKLGVRGAAEGAVIRGGEYAGHELLQDHDLAASAGHKGGMVSAKKRDDL